MVFDCPKHHSHKVPEEDANEIIFLKTTAKVLSYDTIGCDEESASVWKLGGALPYLTWGLGRLEWSDIYSDLIFTRPVMLSTWLNVSWNKIAHQGALGLVEDLLESDKLLLQVFQQKILLRRELKLCCQRKRRVLIDQVIIPGENVNK